MKQIVAIVFCLLALIFQGHAQSEINFVDTTVYINGKILSLPGSSSEKYLVELSDEKGVLNHYTLSKGKRTFRFELKRYHTYTLRIEGDGYLTKILTLNTDMPANSSGNFAISFNIRLQSLKEAVSLSPKVRELPVALIRYDLLAETFVYDLSYATQIKMEIYKRPSTEPALVLVRVKE